MIEFETSDSPNVVIRLDRINSKSRKILLFLNAIVESSIESRRNSPRSTWVTRESVYEHLREGYNYQDFQPWGESFTECSTLPSINLVDHRDYFLGGYQIDRPLRLPNSFEELFNIYFQLDKLLQNKFTRAAYWFNLAHGQKSASARFLHLIQCIETLMPGAESTEVCTHCNREIGKGPTKRFQEFLDELVPAKPELVKKRKQLYKLRSDLTHGWDLFARDLREATMTPKSSDQMLQTLDAYQLARFALVNWLSRQARQSQQSLESNTVVPLA